MGVLQWHQVSRSGLQVLRVRQDVQHWRAISGAVITGIDTVIADDCQLNVRSLHNIDIETVAQPKRVILDRRGRLPLTAKILENPETVMVMSISSGTR